MPFTIAHPAAVLPIHRLSGGGLPLSALVAGSLAPDFVYYAPFGVNGRFSHTAEGLLLFCLPAGVLAWFLFHALFRRPLAALLPDRLFRRLPASVLDAGAWRRQPVAPVLAALGLGALTHIVWDAVTHRHTVAAFGLEPLLTVIRPAGGSGLPLYKLLQHASSAAGIALLLHAALAWMRRAPTVRGPGKSVPAGVKLLVAGTGIAFALASAADNLAAAGSAGIEHRAVRAAVGATTGAGLSLLLYCMGWHAVHVARRFGWTRKMA
ncbi:DUF4184 family protein [Noviherbaspirillum aridicola]|uniref:DUF4184 family protein n=1 Tax=Noviherbaspirillum aridicola TaxID=2849687 RepID=A0ABQ4Q3M7_9BURK|nr:DUF4184 family protein [Noviherbaspirillum aridicola]GIZ51607.1 hypothetical protein NCCP691_16210 [Noviherbaspirillum aridicola]